MSIIRKIFGCLPYYKFPENKQESKTKKKPKKSFKEVLLESSPLNFNLQHLSENNKISNDTSVLDSYNNKTLFD